MPNPGSPQSKQERSSGLASGGALTAVLVGLAGAAGLFLAWMAAGTLLLIFAGLLFAALLDACTRWLSLLLPLSRAWNLTIVSVAIAIVVVGILFWSGFSVAQQINDLMRALNQQLHVLERGMAEIGLAPSAGPAPRRSAISAGCCFPIRISFSARPATPSPSPSAASAKRSSWC